ncbi:hypothetical protein PsYK624_154230 [Phanerochaete sordida]|uniref:Uncharacterized protein n=1 Tax=Phanerochaete sordida TaxID=48140 RepID=A0A9P3LL98_9APHY|nr:hypothetical protein PsYK624_154230 [Phanerochaete sordida]
MRTFARSTYSSRLPTKSLVQTNAEIIPAAHRLPQEIFKTIIDNALPYFPTLCRANHKHVLGQRTPLRRSEASLTGRCQTPPRIRQDHHARDEHWHLRSRNPT